MTRCIIRRVFLGGATASGTHCGSWARDAVTGGEECFAILLEIAWGFCTGCSGLCFKLPREDEGFGGENDRSDAIDRAID